MATIREYYEKDFQDCIKVGVHFPTKQNNVEGNVLYDFTGMNAFISCFVDGGMTLDSFLDLITSINNKVVNFSNTIGLPSPTNYPGEMKISNLPGRFEVLSKFFGETEWISTMNISSTGRVFIYSDSDLKPDEIVVLKQVGKNNNIEIQFRGKDFMTQRNFFQTPLAFISHDSRDKEQVARKIAANLQGKLCPVWYDEYSLKVGDHLRTSIEKGIKECKKCVLILSPNFFSNSGWGKVEFDSIFTRQIFEEKNVILPIWYNITPKEVYEYSPSLANVLGLDWNSLGEDNVCAELYKAIITS